ncbi:MAG: DVU_1551 family NTP transferase [Actinomycetes bacterium]
MKQVSAIVLAAGFSSRMPAFKPLVEVEGRTLLERAVGACTEAGITDVVVVTGHRGAEVATAAQALSARPVRNELFESGMYSSVRVGVCALPSPAGHFFVLPVDCAFVRSETLGRLMRVAHATGADVVYPAVGGKRGHPPLVSAALAPAIVAGDDPDGLRGLLERCARRPIDVPVADDGVRFDADVAADLARARILARGNEIPDVTRCVQILGERGAPSGLVAHARVVAAVATALASGLNERDQHLCLRLVTAAALLHDVARAESDHAAAGAVFLESLGYPRVAGVVRRHMDLGAGGVWDIGEAEVLFLADKLVLGEQEVTLEERFARRLGELAHDPPAQAAARSRLATAEVVRARVEAALGHGLASPAQTATGLRLMSLDGPDLLAADLDGTLLGATRGPATPGVKAAVRGIIQAGSTFCICTGRPSDFARSVAEALGAHLGYAIAYGGAETSELAGGGVIEQVSIPVPARRAVRDVAHAFGLAIDVHDSPAGPLRFVLTGPAGELEHAVVALGKAAGARVSLLRPSAGVVAVQAAAATKERALAALSKRLGISPAAVAYFGDAADDAPALAWAGLGVAVGDGSAEAATAADIVVPRPLVAGTLARLGLARRLRAGG